MIPRIGPSLASCVLCAILCAPVPAEESRSQVAVGQMESLWSAKLGEERRVIVGLPRHYERSGKRYPVVYLLDAETQFVHAAGAIEFLAAFSERIPEAILIGIINVDRGKDLAPPTSDPAWHDDYPVSRAAAFLSFIGDELMPWIDARYRTAPHRILVGHSFGGLFSVYALASRPELFQAHIAISPSLWWDREGWVGRAASAMRRLPKPRWLFLSWGDGEADIRDSTQMLVSALNAERASNLTLVHRYYRGEDHMSTPHRSLYDALEILFAQWRVDPTSDVDAIDTHFAELSKRYGYPILPPATVLQSAARTLLKAQKPAEGIALLGRAMREYPYMAESHYQLAAALEGIGCPETALREHEAAMRIAVEDADRYFNAVADYRAKVRDLAKRKNSGRCASLVND